jgi:hypothetical protein
MNYDAPTQVQFSPPPDVPPPRSKRQRVQGRPEVPDTPEARKHADEAVAVRKLLNRLGVNPGQVSPTRDGQGHVRLNFADIYRLTGRPRG